VAKTAQITALSTPELTCNQQHSSTGESATQQQPAAMSSREFQSLWH